MDQELQRLISRMDTFLFRYTDEESRIDSYATGKDITNANERCVTTVSINPQEPDMFEMILNYPTSIVERTLVMDYRLLTSPIVEVLKNAYQKGIISGIRIIPDNYKITKEIFDRFNDPAFYGFLIATNAYSDEIKNPSSYLDIREQQGLCQIEHIMYDDGEGKDHFNIHITKKLNKEEIKQLVKIIKQHSYQKIMVDFYEPSYYKDLLEMLKEEDISDDIEIEFLANPLYDEVTCYEGLNEILDNKVTIHYNTCHDLNQMFREEPHTEGVRYYSDIEASGFSDSDNYFEMVKMLEEVVSYMESKNYSPLEKIAYLTDYFKKNFIYDPDYQITDHADNANLDRVYRKDRMICEGFSNLYSAILRRSGILCFTYGTDNHQKNIVRIVDEKYGIDQLAIIDPTFDLSAENNHNVFANFLVPIDNDLYAHVPGILGREVTAPEVINVPTSLSMASEYYNSYIDVSNPVYATNPLGYALRMLQLMGLNIPQDQTMTMEERIEYFKSALARSGLTEKIPTKAIVDAISYVRSKEHDYGDEYEEEQDRREIEQNVENRGYTHIDKPKIKLLDGLQVVVKTYTPSLEVDFIKTKSQPMVYKRPRKQKENESNEEFSRYLHEFYDTMFYRRYEESMNMDMDKSQDLEEFEIVEDKEDLPEIVIYRDMDDQSRTFVTEEVLRRFQMGEPKYSISLDEKTQIFEITQQELEYIVSHANNKFAPYSIRFQNFDFKNEITDTMETEDKETQENAPDEILIFRDVDDTGRAFVTKSTLDRFQIATPPSKVFLGHMMVYEISVVDAINIINNANNEFAPYMVRYVNIEFDKPKEETKEEPLPEKKPEDINMFRDVDNPSRSFVTKATLNRFNLPIPSFKVKIGKLMVYEISEEVALEIANSADNQEAPYTLHYIGIKFDEPKKENKPKDEILIFRDIDDSGRTFVTQTTLSRFNIPKPTSTVKLGRLTVYEINPATAIDIINNCNNEIAPYDIKYLSIEFDKPKEKQPVQTENTYKEDAPKEENLIPGTNFRKPRKRRPSESEDHYVAYLEGYYDSIFGNEEDLFTPKKKNEEPKEDDNLIPGTMYEKPRVRDNYETDEEYVDYLEDYYNSIFGTVEKIQEKGAFEPRPKRENETEEDYVEYLAMFYGTPIEKEEKGAGRRK